jgi:hypothetical protein
MLCVVCAWHAIIAVCPTDVAPHWDNLALISLAVIYTLFHAVFFLWMYFVVSLKMNKNLFIYFASLKTYRRRRVMHRKDKEYMVS